MLADRPYTNPIYGTYTFPGSLEVYDNTSRGRTTLRGLPDGMPLREAAPYTIQQLVADGNYMPRKRPPSAFHALNLANGETLIGYLKRYSAMMNVEHKIFGDNLVGFADILASHTDTWSQLNAQPVVPFLEDAWTDINVEGIFHSPPPAGTTYIPVTAPTNPFSQNFLDQGQATPESGPGYGDGSGEEILSRNRFIAYPRLYQNDSYALPHRGWIARRYHGRPALGGGGQHQPL